MRQVFKVIYIVTVALTLATMIGYIHHQSHHDRLRVVDKLISFLGDDDASFPTVENDIDSTSQDSGDASNEDDEYDEDDEDEEDEDDSVSSQTSSKQETNFTSVDFETNFTSVEFDSYENSPSTQGLGSDSGGPCIRNFIASYNESCRRNLRPRPENVPDRWRNKITSNGASRGSDVDVKALCRCVPRGLIGSLTLFTDLKRPTASIDRSLQTGDVNMVGGRWYPNHCVARHRIAIIVPYRNREEHLRRLVYALHPVLQRQQLDYTIFVVEQLEPTLFNRAALLNVGFLEAKAIGNFDCYIFHDVDMIPKDDRNFYTCSKNPRHLGHFRDKRAFKYAAYFGGVVAISPEHFKKVNGFSNKYFGWGGEDDDFRQRIIAQDLKIAPRFPKCVARYANAAHRRDPGNPTSANKKKGRKFRPKHYKREGLQTTKYEIEKIENSLLYTKIYVKLVGKGGD